MAPLNQDGSPKETAKAQSWGGQVPTHPVEEDPTGGVKSTTVKSNVGTAATGAHLVTDGG